MGKIKEEKLYQFPLEYLWEGLILKDNVYDKKGAVLLIPAGEEVTASVLAKLNNFGGEERYLMSGKESYELIMKEHRVDAGAEQSELEQKSGYTELKERIADLFANIKNQGSVSTDLAGFVAENVQKQIEEQTMSVILNCIDTPRPMDEQLQRHCLNVGLLNGMIARSMNLSEEVTYELIITGTLHDIGKTMVNPEILNAPRKLTEEEFEQIKMHPVYSYQILGNDVSERVKEGVLYHHEREQGTGYPDGLQENIPLYAKITAVSDVYDALVEKRCYKDARVPFDVLDEINFRMREGMDEEVIAVFVHLMMNHFRGKKVRMSDGSEGEVFYVPPNDMAHPIIKTGEDIRQVDEYWMCTKVIS